MAISRLENGGERMYTGLVKVVFCYLNMCLTGINGRKWAVNSTRMKRRPNKCELIDQLIALSPENHNDYLRTD